ncbi:hypothetical protein AJ80_05936 [Polytolypa hystricis UAMH7299]|uniref:Uncharacterized protein n=1 Tax=Polytolypa hystricis (strain UAMH7299) TaxID=1447883 RepID=A0A2B7XYQ7_POLH7|nr:hypothetical protein AJ80_05936 [Polytolypa hystricis UAMH7299]
MLDWAQLEINIRQLLHRHGGNEPNINIEFLPGTIEQFTEPPQSGPGQPGVSQLESISLDDKLPMGFSVGIVGERGGGTAGGFGHAHSEWSDQEGNDLKNDKEKQEMNVMVKGEPSKFLQESIELHCHDIEQDHSILRIIEKLPLRLGKVGPTSGRLLFEGRIYDWAFIELSDPMSQKLFRPNPTPKAPDNQTPQRYLKNVIFAPVRSTVAPFGKLEVGGYYFKKGRTTGVTAGVCNGLLAYCNWPAARDRLRYDEFGNLVKVEKGITEEYVIFSKNCGILVHTQDTFALAGDSGSFVLNARFEDLRLVIRGSDGEVWPHGWPDIHVSAGLAMCMSDVEKSVELRTTPRDADSKAIGPPAILGLPE